MITMYKMDDCPLCDKAIRLLEHCGLEYISYNIKPYSDRLYPYFDIDGEIVEYEELADKINKENLEKFRQKSGKER